VHELRLLEVLGQGAEGVVRKAHYGGGAVANPMHASEKGTVGVSITGNTVAVKVTTISPIRIVY
jgi:hypothetical protein